MRIRRSYLITMTEHKQLASGRWTFIENRKKRLVKAIVASIRRQFPGQTIYTQQYEKTTQTEPFFARLEHSVELGHIKPYCQVCDKVNCECKRKEKEKRINRQQFEDVTSAE